MSATDRAREMTEQLLVFAKDFRRKGINAMHGVTRDSLADAIEGSLAAAEEREAALRALLAECRQWMRQDYVALAVTDGESGVKARAEFNELDLPRRIRAALDKETTCDS